MLTQKVCTGDVSFLVCGNEDDEFVPQVRYTIEFYLLAAALRAESRRLRQVIDIGANIGITAMLAAKLAPQARVLAVEPAAQTFASLQHTIRANRLEDRVVAVRALASSSARRLRFRERSDNSAQSGISDTEGEWMDALPGDEIARTHGFDAVDFVKIDAEGHDREVLAGLSDTVRRRNPAILIEVSAMDGADPWPFLEELLGRFGQWLYFGGNMDAVQHARSERDARATLRYCREHGFGDLVVCADRERFAALAARIGGPIPPDARRRIARTPKNLFRFLAGRLHG